MRRVTAVCPVLAAACGPGFQGRAGEPEAGAAAPAADVATNVTVLTSDRAMLDYEKGVVVYEGNVVVVDPDMTVKADKMTVDYQGANRIRTIIAEGNVRLERREGVATGRRAIFDAEKRVVTLTGQPMLRRGDDVLSGDVITLLLREKKMICEPARTVFHPGRSSTVFNWFEE